ncbi:MAG: efflux RND transporter permease subunit [Planctomycetota bacterium]
MDPVRFALDNPVKVAVGVILVLMMGLIALGAIPVQLTPDVDPTIVTVVTDWEGKSPEEIEKDIIEEQEDVLKGVRGLRQMTATAVQGEAIIQLEFNLGVEVQEARVEVSDALREVPAYPEGVEEPVIVTGESGPGSPIAWLLLQSETPGFDVQKLGDPAEDRIKPFLERVDGVSELRVYGGREREVHLTFDPAKVAQRGVTLAELGGALRQENTNVSAGEIAEGQNDVRVRVVGEFDSLEKVRQTILAYDADGGAIRVGDVAEVELAYGKRRSFVRSRGSIAMAFPVYRESGANVMRVMDALDVRLEEVNRDLLPRVAAAYAAEEGLATPPELRIRKVYDETVYIDDALALVSNNLLIGGGLAVLVLLLFLRSVRPTVVVGLAIPISVIGTFVVMAALGRNINVISLAGLAFAVGMVVDNAIVVLENIDRHLGMGKKPMRAAYDATREVWGAILASTLTTLVVFLPIVFMQEEAGQLFRDITIAICAAVSLSLLVSVTVIPTGSGRFLRSRKNEGAWVSAARSLGGLVPLLGKVGRGFSDVIYAATARTAGGVVLRVVVVGMFAVSSVAGAWLLMPPTDYLPAGNKNLVFGFILKAPGFTLDKAESDAVATEQTLRPLWEAEDYSDLEGAAPIFDMMSGQPIENLPPMENYFHVSFQGNAFHGATSVDKENVAALAPALSSAAMTGVPGAFGFSFQSTIFGRGAENSRTINVEVMGPELESVKDSAIALMGGLRELYGFPGVRPDPANFDKQSREVTLRIDGVKARELGLSNSLLGGAVEAFVDGAFVGDFRYRGEAIDIQAKRKAPGSGAGEERAEAGGAGGAGGVDVEALRQVPIAYARPDGTTGTVRLGEVAQVERTLAPQQIRRIEEERSVLLQVSPPEEMPLEQASSEVRALVEELRGTGAIDPSVRVALEGSASKLDDVRTALLGKWEGLSLASISSIGTGRLFLALVVVYLLMAALFESFLYPMVIMIAVPLATVGGFIGLAITHWFEPSQQLDTLTMLGFVILIGVVVNNAILLVHQTLNFMRGVGEGEGDDTGALGYREAIRASVRSRVRPILMTTLTSVAGMLPLVLMPGSGSELYRGLGSVVGGGLVVATVFTLVVVPLLLTLVFDGLSVVRGEVEGLEQGVA